MRMKWTILGIVYFSILEGMLAQQGYNYPKPETPFPGHIASADRPGTITPSGRPSTSPDFGGFQPGQPGVQQGPIEPQRPGSYSDLSNGARPSTGYPTPDRPTGSQSPTGTSGTSGNDFLGNQQRPFAPGGSFGQETPGKPSLGRPQGSGSGVQQPSNRFPEPNGPSTGGQQGYNYPTPGKPFSGASPLPTGPGLPTLQSTGGNQQAGYPGQQGPGTPTNEYQRPSQPGTSGTTGTGRFPGSQRPIPGQGTGGPPGQLDASEQQRPNSYPGVGRTTETSLSNEIERPSGGRFPEPTKPISSNIIGSGQQSGYSGTGTAGTQFSSGVPQNPSGQTGAAPQLSPSKPQTSFGQAGGYPGFAQNGAEFPRQEGNEGYSNAGRPTGTQFPTSSSQPGSPGTHDFGRPQGTQFPSNQPQTSSGSTGGYPGSSSPSQGFPGHQNSQGYQSTGRPSGTQFPSSGRPSSGVTGVGRPEGPQFSSNEPQPSSGRQEFPGKQGPGRYPGDGKPSGQFPTAESLPSGRPQFPTGGSEGSLPQRPPSDYLPPDQETGRFPTPGKPTRPQLPTGGPGQEAPKEPLGPSRLPGQSAFQPGNNRYDTPGSERGQQQFPSGDTQRPTGNFEKPNSYPTSERPGGFQFQPSNGAFRPEQSTGPKPQQGNTQTDFGTPNFPGASSRPQTDLTSGGPSGFPGQQEGADGGQYEGGDFSAIPGQPDVDYPILSSVPETSFRCEDQQYPGYYADVETRCQVFHICANDRTYDFLCPNGTIFHQEYLVCVWWNQFDCNTAQSLYGVNENIYDFSITGGQTGGIPVPGPGYPITPGGPVRPPQGTSRPGESDTQPGSSGEPGGYPRPQFAGQTPSGTSSGARPETGLQQPGYPSTFPPGPGSTPSQYPSGATQVTSQRPGGYADEKPTSPPGIGSESQGPTRYPSQSTTGSQAFGGYSNGKPQVPRFAPTSGVPGSPTTPQGPERPGGYSSAKPQESTFPSRPQQPGFGSQNQVGYPSQSIGSGDEDQKGSYPSGKLQESTFPSRPQTPGFGSQSQSGYPSQSTGGGNGSHKPSEDRPGSAGFVGSQPQRPDGYPSGRPQGAGFPAAPGRPQASSGAPGTTQGTETGQPQIPGGYPNETPQGSFASEAGKHGVPGTGLQTPGRYPSGTIGPDRRPVGYPSERPQGSAFSSSSGGEPQSFPSRPGTPFPGSPKPHEPTREYLPSATRR